jgi:hypothetical protein
MSTEIYWMILNFVKIGVVEAMLYWKAYVNFYLYSTHCCPILIKFGAKKSARSVSVKLWVSCKSAQEFRNFMGVNEITFTRVRWNPRTFWK